MNNFSTQITVKPKYLLIVILILTIQSIAQSVCLNIKEVDRKRVIDAAEKYLKEFPVTITSSTSSRSAGGVNDYFSEGDYWWPDPKNAEGSYIQKDGMTNPDNFVSHRQALMRFSVQASTLAAAYKITGEEKYAAQAILHIKAWFVIDSTRMNPHLKYAQAIKGKVTGRGIGIIDTIHLIEIAKAIEALEKSSSWVNEDISKVKDWFREYLEWMTIDQYGIEEREAKNNHGTCWVFQTAAFSELVGDTAKMEYCRKRFKEVLLPNQMGVDGSFPLELKRTKPYGYSLFNLEAMAGICQILSTKEDNLWKFKLPDGRNMRKAMEFIYPYIKDKSKWTYPPDVMCFENWPVRQSSLLFAGLTFNESRYTDLWKTLDPDPTVEEVIRNYPVRQPVLWINDDNNLPDVNLMSGTALLETKMLYRSGKMIGSIAIKKLLREAETALSVKPMSVVDKKQVPPSGDKHDYLSVAPYWWPDSTKTDGLPYIRRDGERNPDRDLIGDRNCIGDMIKSVNTLALAYYISGREDYAIHAAELLRVWFLNPETRMNPNLNYAQSIRGMNEGRGSGIIDTYGYSELVDAISLLCGSVHWQTHDHAAIVKWFDEYLQWLLTSENGMKEAAAKNNHGTTYAVQVSTIAMFVGKENIAEEIIKMIPSARISKQIEPDGSEPFELVRTKSWGYCLLNLEALVQLAQMGEKFGIDLWTYSTTDGRSIRKVIDWLLPYAIDEKAWKYPQIVPMEKERIYPILQIASVKYKDSKYLDSAKRIPGIDVTRLRTNLYLPKF
jgi:hypothetical protein